MFQVNEVLEVEGKCYRILDARVTEYIWFELHNPKALPTLVHLEQLKKQIDDGYLKRIKDPYEELLFDTPVEGSIAYERREKSMALISTIVEDSKCLDAKVRSQRISKVVERERTHKTVLYRLLRRYWERGQIDNAFVPDYKNSGGKGKKRVSAASKGVGRPRLHASGKTTIINEEVESLFRRIIEKYLLKSKQIPITKAYSKFQDCYLQYFPETSEQELPTKRQFEYFYKREYDAIVRLQSQTPSVDYQKDVRPILSTATENALGPGSRYEIDATIADIYLVADHGRKKIIGRPTIYMVIDVFSRLVAGFYVGMDSPSYVTAMQAIVHAFTDKKEYCKKLGTEITSEEWPSVGLPDCLLADRGELMSHQADALARIFRINLEAAPPYRGDAKGIVERYFRTIQAEFKPYAPGVVQGFRIKKHGERDYRLDATLSLRDFREIILNVVLFHNKSKVLRSYDRSEDMPENLPSIPIKLWRWGVQNRVGRLRKVNEQSLRINLLPRNKVSISEHGVRIFGRYYTGPEILKAGWLHRRAHIKRPQNLNAAYDLGTVDHIYLFPDKTKSLYWECNLATKSREFKGMTFWEAWQKQDEVKKSTAEYELAEKKHKREVDRFVESKIKTAERLRKPTTSSNAQRLQEINKNKTEIKQQERKENALRPERAEHEDQAVVIPIADDSESAKYPDIMPELNNDDD